MVVALHEREMDRPSTPQSAARYAIFPEHFMRSYAPRLIETRIHFRERIFVMSQ
jgi:hypothetical protein